MLARKAKEVKSMTILGFCRWLIGKDHGRFLMQGHRFDPGFRVILEKGMTIYSSIS